MEEKYFYVTMKFDYADEFYVYGSFVCTEAKRTKLEDKIRDALSSGRELELYFGSNEALEVSDYDSFMRNVEFKQCTKQFHDEFLALNRYGFGFNVIESLLDRVR